MDERKDSVTKTSNTKNPDYPKARLVCGEVELLLSPISVLFRVTVDREWLHA